MTGLGKNRVTEKDLRDWLNENGYVGQFAKIEDLELFAIKPPGWHQVFRFSVEVRRREEGGEEGGEERPWLAYHGVIVDDERKSQGKQTQVWMFDEEQQQQAKLAEVSEGMIHQNRESVDFRVTAFLFGFVAIFLVFIVILQRWMG